MNFTFQNLTSAFVKANIQDFIKIAKDNIEDEYWGEDNFLAELNAKWVYSFAVIGEGNGIIGFLIASEKPNSVHIHKLVIDSQFQKKGLGTLMMENILKKTTMPITLKVQQKNLSGLSFYQRNGFVVNGRQDDLYTMIHHSNPL